MGVSGTSDKVKSADALAEKVLKEYTQTELAEMRAWPTAKKQELAAALLMRGLAKSGVAKVLDMRPISIAMWFQREPDQMREFMKEAQKRAALFELPANFKLLLELRDQSSNAETRRKAALDIARMAGVPIDALNAATVNNNLRVNGDVNFAAMGFREINNAIARLAQELGPEAVALAKKQIGQNYERIIDAPGAVVKPAAKPGGEAGALPAPPPRAATA